MSSPMTLTQVDADAGMPVDSRAMMHDATAIGGRVFVVIYLINSMI